MLQDFLLPHYLLPLASVCESLEDADAVLDNDQLLCTVAETEKAISQRVREVESEQTILQ